MFPQADVPVIQMSLNQRMHPCRPSGGTPPEHFLPLLYVLGTQSQSDGVAFFAEQVTLGSMSMRSVKIG
jgi:aromatic ring-opening dioxygenase catalytic subunit (LigB family)